MLQLGKLILLLVYKMTLNAVTDTSTLRILRAGYTDFFNDGSFDGANETFHADISSLIEGEPLRHQKIVAGDPTLLTAPEQTTADAEIETQFQAGLLFSRLVPPEEPETISTTPTTLNITSYVSIVGDSQVLTLPDATFSGHAKLLSHQGGGPDTQIICSLVGAFTGFDIGGNGKAELLWSAFESAWLIVDEKNLTKNV